MAKSSFTIYTPENSGHTRTGKATLRFVRKGANQISGKACEVIGLKEKDTVAVMHYDKNPEDFYLIKHASGFILRGGAPSRSASTPVRSLTWSWKNTGWMMTLRAYVAALRNNQWNLTGLRLTLSYM